MRSFGVSRHIMMPPRFLAVVFLLVCAWIGFSSALPLYAETEEGPDVGFAYDDFELTLEPGHRTEIAGPYRPSEELAVVACGADPSPPHSL